MASEASNHVARVLSVATQLAGLDANPDCRFRRRCLINHKLDPARRDPPRTLTESEIRGVTRPIESSSGSRFRLEDLARILRDSVYCVNLPTRQDHARWSLGATMRDVSRVEDLHGFEFRGGL
jgi:hypothetical protein